MAEGLQVIRTAMVQPVGATPAAKGRRSDCVTDAEFDGAVVRVLGAAMCLWLSGELEEVRVMDDEIVRCTKFRVVCPACGRVGLASWTRTENQVKCRGCGEAFDWRGHAYRPVTGGMTEDERREHARARARAYRDEHREERNAYFRRYYAANREECLARHRRYCAEHREELNAKGRAYYYANREECLARHRRYCAEHREELAEKAKARRVAKWRAEHGKENR